MVTEFDLNRRYLRETPDANQPKIKINQYSNQESWSWIENLFEPCSAVVNFPRLWNIIAPTAMVIYGGNIQCLANTRLLVLANKLSSYLSIGVERAADYTVSVYTRFTYTYNTTCWVIPSTLPNMEVKSKTTVCGGSGHLLRSVSYKLSTLFDLFQSGVHSFSWALKKKV